MLAHYVRTTSRGNSMGWKEDGIPNPGSDAALDAGCICPVMDNAHGKRPPFPPNGWWINEGCLVHSFTEEEREAFVDDPSGDDSES